MPLSPYIIVGAVTGVFAIVGSSAKFEKIAYYISLVLLTLFLAFRYGQGTDWLAYNYIFESSPSDIDFNDVYYTDSFHSEIGWKILNNVFKALGLDFVALSILSSLTEMLMLAKFISNYSPNRALSLFVAFPVVYLTYFFFCYTSRTGHSFLFGSDG